MTDSDRRTFLKKSAAAAAAIGLGGAASLDAATAGGAASRTKQGGAQDPGTEGQSPATASAQESPALSSAMLVALGAAVLPVADLGSEGVARVAEGFQQWLDGFRAEAELPHAYLNRGLAEIRYGPQHPWPRWAAQIERLEREAQERHAAPFPALSPDQQVALVAAQLEPADLRRLGGTAQARHVAVALMAFFYDSARATDLCYNAAIGRYRCRGLAGLGREPRPLPPGAVVVPIDRPAPAPAVSTAVATTSRFGGTIETDVCIIGGGISAAMVAEKLAETTAARISVVEAGDRIFNLSERYARRSREIAYGENPWPNDHVEGQTGYGLQSRSMAVGGQALHWGGATPRFTPEDFRMRSLYGVGDDWPLDYDELEPFYQEAEERIGVSGEQGPAELDARSRPYPMAAIPRTYNLERLKEWAEMSGIPFWTNPVAKTSVPYRGRNVCARCDTCEICPTGAKYSPDFTFRALLEAGRIELYDRMLARRLLLAEGSDRIEEALAVPRDQPGRSVRLRARVFVLASGFTWSPHLLLLSASDRFPDGLANRSGLLGKYLTGHASVNAYADVPLKLYPGMYEQHSLLSKRFQRPGSLDRYVRHDLRIWESSSGRQPRLQDDDGETLWGDAVMADWRRRTATGAARLRAYYDVLPARDSELTLDPDLTNEWGDPMPRLTFRDAEESIALREHTIATIEAVFQRIVDAGGGSLRSVRPADIHDHPAGGCRAGADPATSVVDPWGRSHDHENLWVVGAPTAVSGGCANGTLTFSALSLRSAAKIAEELPAG